MVKRLWNRGSVAATVKLEVGIVYQNQDIDKQFPLDDSPTVEGNFKGEISIYCW